MLRLHWSIWTALFLLGCQGQVARTPAPESEQQTAPLYRSWRPLPSFSHIDLCAPLTVLVLPTPDSLASVANYSVVVRAEPAVFQSINTTVYAPQASTASTSAAAPPAAPPSPTSTEPSSNATLRIETFGSFSSSRIIQIFVYLPATALRSVSVSAGSVQLGSGFAVPSLSLRLGGTSSVVAPAGLQADALSIATSGATTVWLNGSFASRVGLAASGISNVALRGVNGSVEASLSGISDVYLLGTPSMRITGPTTTGSASVYFSPPTASCRIPSLSPFFPAVCKPLAATTRVPTAPVLRFPCGLDVLGNFTCGGATAAGAATSGTGGLSSSSSVSSTTSTAEVGAQQAQPQQAAGGTGIPSVTGIVPQVPPPPPAPITLPPGITPPRNFQLPNLQTTTSSGMSSTPTGASSGSVTGVVGPQGSTSSVICTNGVCTSNNGGTGAAAGPAGQAQPGAAASTQSVEAPAATGAETPAGSSGGSASAIFGPSGSSQSTICTNGQCVSSTAAGPTVEGPTAVTSAGLASPPLASITLPSAEGPQAQVAVPLAPTPVIVEQPSTAVIAAAAPTIEPQLLGVAQVESVESLGFGPLCQDMEALTYVSFWSSPEALNELNKALLRDAGAGAAPESPNAAGAAMTP